MAYYSNPQQQAGIHSSTAYQAFAPTGLASYGGATSYQAGQQNYYNGPSYSTTSDNDFVNNLPVAGYGPSSYFSGYQNYGISSYGGASYSCDPYSYHQTLYQQPPPSATYSRYKKETSGSEELAPQIEAAYEAATGQRRQPVIKRQVITIPGAPGRVQQIVRRLPTPTPDVVERVFVVKPQRDVVNLVIERPGTPPALYKDKTIYGKPRKPLINPLIVRVSARSQPQLPYYSYQQSYVPSLPAPTQQGVSYQYQQPPVQQTLSQTQQQPSLSTQQYQQQGISSQIRLSQSSQTQLQQPVSQPGYTVAPTQYEDQQQQFQQKLQQQPPISSSYNYQGIPTTQNVYNNTQASYAPTNSGYGAGYSTGAYPSQVAATGTYSGYSSTPYPYTIA